MTRTKRGHLARAKMMTISRSVADVVDAVEVVVAVAMAKHQVLRARAQKPPTMHHMTVK
jgi:hypothetical protein